MPAFWPVQEEDQYTRYDGRTDWVRWSMTPWRRANGDVGGALLFAEIITEQVEARRALAESEERLRLAQLKTGVGIWDWDLRADKVTWTPELAAIYGVEPGYMKCFADFCDRVHPDDIEVLRANQEAAVQRGETFRHEFRIIRPDGKVRWLLSIGGAVYDAATGKPNRILGNNVDITERKVVELALAERNTQLELASKSARVGSLAIDFHTGLVKLSPGCATILGLPESTVGMSTDDAKYFVHPEDLISLELRRDQALLRQQREFVAQFRIRRADDGEVRWIEARNLIFYDQSGKPSQMIGVRIDFTDRKLAADMLAERNLQLGLAGKAGRVGCFAYDVGAEELQISEAFAALHGLPEGTTATTLKEWQARVYPADLGRVEGVHDQAVADKRREYSVEYRIVRSDGEVSWTESRCSISYDSDGRARRVVGVSIDITERTRTEQALTDRNRQLELAAKHALVGRYAIEIDAGQEDFNLHRLQFSPGFAAIYGLSEETMEISLGHWRSLVHPDDLPQFLKHRQQLFAERRSDHHAEHRIVRPCGTIRWIEARSFIEYDQAGHAKRMVGVNIDITERKRAEEARKVLNAELDHRVKNALATVTAVISHTRQGSRSVAEFAAALEGRIRSMAATQELLSARRWQGISLTELVRSELAPYATSNNTKINGPEVILKLEAGQPVAMVLHELATNAAKYGALSSKEGCVSIQWDLRQNGHATHLVLEWKEIGGPPVVASDRSSFGMSTICDLIPHEFGGTVDLTLDLDGVRCRVELPAQWFSKDEPVSEAIARAPRKTATKLDRS